MLFLFKIFLKFINTCYTKSIRRFEMIVLAYDHRAFSLMIKIKSYLKSLGEEYVEFASPEYDKSDSYSEFAKQANQYIVSHPEAKGIYSCRTGIGIAMAGNRQKGIRAGVCSTEKITFLARNDDDMNVLVVPATTPMWKVKRIIKVFLNTPFEGGRHIPRVNALDN